MSATRYGIMMLRYARTAASARAFNRRLEYPRQAIV
jgi:hypothetical protein